MNNDLTGEIPTELGNLQNLDYFGIAVSGGGDVNNDGYDDVVVGARQYVWKFGIPELPGADHRI